MQNDFPLVSIAAVCYNHQKFLAETLNSIRDQTYPNLEVIILDDCSTDNSVEKIRQWLKANDLNWRFVAHTENRGLCKTLNKALSLLNGEFYQMISCDDVLYPDKIDKQVKLFNSLPKKVSVVCGDIELIDTEGNTLDFDHTKFNEDKVMYNDLLKECVIRAPSVLIRKSIFDIVGNYDENLYFEDWDLWLRISKVSEIIKDNRVNVKYRRMNGSMYYQKRNPHYLQTIFMIMDKQLPASKEYRKIVHGYFIRNIESLYVNPCRLYWLKKILKNYFSIVPIIHYTAACLGIKYTPVKNAIRSGKKIKTGIVNCMPTR